MVRTTGYSGIPDPAFRLLSLEVRNILYTTYAIESLHSQVRKAIRNKGHVPSASSASRRPQQSSAGIIPCAFLRRRLLGADYRSIQVPNHDAILGIDECLGILTNVFSVDISGLELELRVSPWDNGFVSLDLGHLEDVFSVVWWVRCSRRSTGSITDWNSALNMAGEMFDQSTLQTSSSLPNSSVALMSTGF